MGYKSIYIYIHTVLGPPKFVSYICSIQKKIGQLDITMYRPLIATVPSLKLVVTACAFKVAADALPWNNHPLFFSASSLGQTRSHSILPQTLAHSSAAILDISELEKLVQFHFTKCLALSTQGTYKAAQRRYLRCNGFVPLYTHYPICVVCLCIVPI